MEVKILNRLLALVASVVLAGCAAEPPNCSDAEVSSLLQSVLSDIYNRAAFSDSRTKAAEVLKFTVEMQRPTAYDKEIKLRRCSAQLKVSTSAESQQFLKTQYQEYVQKDKHELGGIFGLFEKTDKERRQRFQAFEAYADGKWPQDTVQVELQYSVQLQEGSSSKFIVSAELQGDTGVPYFSALSWATDRMRSSAASSTATTAPTPSAATAPTSPPPQPGSNAAGSPELAGQRMVVVNSTAMCTDEALCVDTSKGEFRVNAFGLSEQEKRLLSSQNVVCLRGVTKEHDLQYFDNVTPNCGP